MMWPFSRRRAVKRATLAPPADYDAVRAGVDVIAGLPQEEQSAIMALLAEVSRSVYWPGIKALLAEKLRAKEVPSLAPEGGGAWGDELAKSLANAREALGDGALTAHVVSRPVEKTREIDGVTVRYFEWWDFRYWPPRPRPTDDELRERVKP